MSKKIFIFSIIFLIVFGLLFFNFRKTEEVEAAPDTKTLRPNAAGITTNIELQYPSSGDHYDKVKEVPYDTTTYIRRSGTDITEKLDTYIPDTTIPAGSTINSLTIYTVCMTTAIYDNGNGWWVYGAGRPALRTQATNYTGGNLQTFTEGYITYSYTWNDNPNTLVDWTPEDINALEIGVSLRTYKANIPANYAYPRCTQVYAVVDYIPPALPPLPPSNVSGWAWSNTIGWISFSRADCDPDGDEYSVGVPQGCPGTALIPVFIPYYGVNIVPVGPISQFTGYAWSEHIGWISFDLPLGSNPPSWPNIVATLYPEPDNDVLGWARACAGAEDTLNCSGGANPNSGGWDGWIKMQNEDTLSDEDIKYKVWLDTNTGPPYEFRGWAWGSDVVGWISWNVRNCDVDGDGQYEGAAEGAPTNCPSSGTAYDYKVLYQPPPPSPPTAESLSVDPSVVCGKAAGCRMRFKWEFKDPDIGDSQSAYQIQVDNDSNFSSPEVDSCVPAPGTCGTGHASPEFVNDPPYPLLNWGATYYWRLMVWDKIVGNPSDDWIYPPSPPGSPTAPPGNPFPTPLHSYPAPDFDIDPKIPSAGQDVTFIDKSFCYDAANNSYFCNTLATNLYQWDFNNDGTVESTYGGTVVCENCYTAIEVQKAKLTITDDLGTCSETKDNITIRLPLPEWKETPPF
jgi:hypothetical protein